MIGAGFAVQAGFLCARNAMGDGSGVSLLAEGERPFSATCSRNRTAVRTTCLSPSCRSRHSMLDLACASLLNRASANKGNSAMAKKPTKHRSPWTASEVRELKALARKKLGREKIAQKLKRTAASVQNRAVSEGVSLSTR
jgi:hypothetical protein